VGVAKQARIKARANGHDVAHSTPSTITTKNSKQEDVSHVVHTMTCIRCGRSAVARKNHEPQGSAIRERCEEVIDEHID